MQRDVHVRTDRIMFMASYTTQYFCNSTLSADLCKVYDVIKCLSKRCAANFNNLSPAKLLSARRQVFLSRAPPPQRSASRTRLMHARLFDKAVRCHDAASTLVDCVAIDLLLNVACTPITDLRCPCAAPAITEAETSLPSTQAARARLWHL